MSGHSTIFTTGSVGKNRSEFLGLNSLTAKRLASDDLAGFWWVSKLLSEHKLVYFYLVV